MTFLEQVRAGAHRAKGAVDAHPYITAAAGVSTLALVVAGLAARRRARAVGEQVVDKIRSVLGTPYIWGGRDPSQGLDCSGAIVWALRALGLESKKFNATADDLYHNTSSVLLPQPGDLVFYGGLPLVGKVTHVMVYAGDGKVVGASGGGPSTTTAEKARAANAAVKELPVNYRSDLRGYGRLAVQPAKDTEVVGLIGIDLLGAK